MVKIRKALFILIFTFIFVACENGPPPDPYTEINPPFKVTKNVSDVEIEYIFSSTKPALKIKNGLISRESANQVLEWLKLPTVDEQGKNAEKFFVEGISNTGTRVGSGRLLRGTYVWVDYELGILMFIKEKYNPKYKKVPYDALDKIVIKLSK